MTQQPQDDSEPTTPVLKSWREAVTSRCAPVKPMTGVPTVECKTKLEELFQAIAFKQDYNEIVEKVSIFFTFFFFHFIIQPAAIILLFLKVFH